MSSGISITQNDATAIAKAKAAGYSVGDDFEQNLIWEPSLRLDLRKLHVVFPLLDLWDVVVVLRPDDQIVGDDSVTVDIIGEGRIPVYDSRAVWIRDSPVTKKLLTVWEQQKELGNDDFALIRALWLVKPKYMPIPASWVL